MSPLAPRIRALRASGLSLRAIAREVGCGYGTVQKHAAAVPAPVAPLRRPAPAPKPPYYLGCAGPGACHWPISSGRPWRFCPEPVSAPGMVYCRRHEALAMPAQRRAAA